MDNENLIGYNAAIDTAAFYIWPSPGCLRLSGPDQTAFVQRQTTNDLHLLTPDRSVLTVLTNPAARILDVFYLLQDVDETVILTLPGRGASTYRYLRSRIFFMDKVTLANASGEISQIELLGPQSGEAIKRLGPGQLREAGEVVRWNLNGQNITVFKNAPAFGQGYRLLTPTDALGLTVEALESAGASRLDGTAFESLRVEAGLPAAAHELSEAYTPLEAGLEVAVSGNKGCYTGQEVLARQITYDKVTQRLAGLRLQQPVEPGTRLWTGGRAVGEVTSAVDSPRFGPIALTIVKRPSDTPGTALIASAAAPSGAGDTGIGAVVVPLPFHST